MKKVITDFGYSPILVDTATGEETNIGRFGVWVVDRRYSKDEVIDTGDNLEALQEKHGPGLEVYPIPQRDSVSESEGSA